MLDPKKLRQSIDEIANKLKIDPIEFRLMNASKEGTREYTIDLTERFSGLTSFHHTAPHFDPVSIILILFISFILYSTRPYNSKGN